VNARKARERKRLQLNEIRQVLAESQAATPRFAGYFAGQELWRVGDVLHVVPILKDAYPDELKAAIDRRRRAAMTGKCDCGSTWQVLRRGRVQMAHEDDCPAADAVLFAIGERYGYHFSRWAA
jgi:hypothetical protein